MQDLKAHSCLMGFEIGKMLRAKLRVSINMRAHCQKHAVTLLTKLGHVDEQLKEGLKSQKEENRKCLLKIFQSIFYLPHQAKLGVKFQAAPLSPS